MILTTCWSDMKPEIENIVYSEPCFKTRYVEPFCAHQKIEIVFYTCVLEFNFACISGSRLFISSKKVYIAVSYCPCMHPLQHLWPLIGNFHIAHSGTTEFSFLNTIKILG